MQLETVGHAVQSISPLGSSFADVAGIGVANLSAVAGLPPSVVDCAIAQLQVPGCLSVSTACRCMSDVAQVAKSRGCHLFLCVSSNDRVGGGCSSAVLRSSRPDVCDSQTGNYPLQADDVESEGATTHNSQGLPKSGSDASARSSAEHEVLHSVSKNPASKDDAPDSKSSLAALQAYLAEYVPPDSLVIRVPSEAIAAVWKLLQVRPSPSCTAGCSVDPAGHLSCQGCIRRFAALSCM